MKSHLLALSSLLLVGCTTAALKIANLPARFSDHKVIKDVSYGDLAEQKLDIYIPQRAASEKQPIVVFFYGGRWTDGAKDLYAFVGDTFADKGYITVVADYRKNPDVKFPDFVKDGAKAVAWTYTHIQDYGGNPENLYIAGHSSGAHIGALIAADDRYLRQEGVSSSIINAFAGLAGPYDFVPETEDLKDIFGPPENYPQMQVTTFIDGNEPPMLLLWGEDDDVVARRNTDRLAKKIKSERGQVETKIYPDVSHVDIVSSLTWFFREKRPVLEDIVAFFEKYQERWHRRFDGVRCSVGEKGSEPNTIYLSPEMPSFRRKPESRMLDDGDFPWIPAYAGMTKIVEFVLSKWYSGRSPLTATMDFHNYNSVRTILLPPTRTDA